MAANKKRKLKMSTAFFEAVDYLVIIIVGLAGLPSNILWTSTAGFCSWEDVSPTRSKATGTHVKKLAGGIN